jgi:hypothetical protein
MYPMGFTFFCKITVPSSGAMGAGITILHAQKNRHLFSMNLKSLINQKREYCNNLNFSFSFAECSPEMRNKVNIQVLN